LISSKIRHFINTYIQSTMTRTKQAARRGRGGRKSDGANTRPKIDGVAPTPASLIGESYAFKRARADGTDKAHTLLAQSNFELAAQFLDRALELEPTNLEARELLGVAHLEAGDPEIGRTVRNAFINSWSQRLMR
jgi:hypothetical protein